MVIAAFGSGLMALPILILDAAGAAAWLVTLPWWLPTLASVLWTLRGPEPAVATDDDDDSWAIYSIRLVLVGADEPRPTPVRVVAALLLGAPVCWALLLIGILVVLGVV